LRPASIGKIEGSFERRISLAEEKIAIDTLDTRAFNAAGDAGATTTIDKSALEDQTPPKVTGEEPAKEYNEKRDEQQGHRNRGAEKRIERLLKDRGAARAEAASLKERLARYESGPANGSSNGAEPQEQSQESESYSGHSSEQRSGPEDDSKFQALRQRYSDFDQVMERAGKENLRISDQAAKVLHSLDHGLDIAYRLASDDELRNDFNKLSPAQQIEKIRGANAEHSKFARVQPFLQQIKQTFSDEEIAEITKAEEKNKVGADIAFGMTRELQELPNGPDVWAHIVKDSEISKRLARMSASQRTLELGRISARLEERSRPRSVSQVPPPFRPVGGSSTRSTVPLDAMSPADYNRARESGRVR
jgi:hypothetical protein